MLCCVGSSRVVLPVDLGILIAYCTRQIYISRIALTIQIILEFKKIPHFDSSGANLVKSGKDMTLMSSHNRGAHL